MPRPEYEDSAADEGMEDVEMESPQSSIDYLQHSGETLSMVQEGSTGTVFATKDESSDEA